MSFLPGPELWGRLFGILLIVLMFLMPTGIVGGVYAILRSLRRPAATADSGRPAAAPAKPAASRSGD